MVVATNGQRRDGLTVCAKTSKEANMATGLRLFRMDFDTLENDYSEALCKTEIGIYIDEPDNKTAYKKVDEVINRMEPVHIYLGWDNKVYPQFVVEKVNIE